MMSEVEMLCDCGRTLYERYETAHRELAIAKKEVQSASATQSEHRLGKVEEVERGAAAVFNQHQQKCAVCKAEEVSST